MVRRAWMHAGLPNHTASTMIDAQCSSAQQSTHLVNAMIKADAIKVGIACGDRVDVADPARRQRARRARRPAAGRLGHRPAQPVRGRRPDRRQPRASAAPRSTASGCGSQQKARTAVDEGRFEREIFSVEAPVLDGDGQPHRRDPGRDTDQGLRETTPGGARRASTPVLRGRHPHRRHVLADLRRRLGAAPDGRRPGRVPRAEARAPGSSPTAWSAPIRTTTSTVRCRRPRSCSPTPACPSPTSTSARSTRPSPRVVMSWAKVHECRPDKINVNGGAIAIGHPVGSTGTRLLTTALHELERRDATTALVSMCAGGARPPARSSSGSESRPGRWGSGAVDRLGRRRLGDQVAHRLRRPRPPPSGGRRPRPARAPSPAPGRSCRPRSR